jgi:UrcA family protein
MFRTMIAAAAALSSTVASATAPVIRFDGDRAYIGYRDLNLQSHVGRSALTGRIQLAARRLCGGLDGGPQLMPHASHCYRVAVESGLDQMEVVAGPKSGS